MTAHFSLGIDLGTSNSAAAVADFADSDETHVVEILQILGPTRGGERPTLPSALYLPHPDEFPEGAFPLPWAERDGAIVGQFARERGALAPDRLVASAKSWLSNPHIDPRQPILPWRSDDVERKLSPFECSRRYLRHVAEAFRHANPGRDLADGEIVVTVPASFDEIARTLTAEAAKAAGLGDVILLEEPLAAFYAWTAHAGRAWRESVAPGDLVLVCDIGGGTADFSLIAVTDVNGNLELERISVGEHILLGGDNMDLALAYTLQAQIEETGASLDAWQFLALAQAASNAKIALFENPKLTEAPIAVPSRGSRLFAGTVSSALARATLEQVVLDGFFPMTRLGDMPGGQRGGGLQEFGLPYASDPVVSKHIARFLARSLRNVRASDALSALVKPGKDADALMPTAVLFNGGVFKAAAMRERVLDVLASWNGGHPVRELQGFEPDLAVARGAAIYGKHRATGKGMRIKAGTARSYYIGLETSMPAVPGFKPPIKALCVAPQGMQEGTEIIIEGQEFGLVTGEAAEFRFFSSAVRSGDAPGEILPNAERELDEAGLLDIELPAQDETSSGEGPAEQGGAEQERGGQGTGAQSVPVKLEAVVTELGILELWMKHTNSDRRWKVEFQVRTE